MGLRVVFDDISDNRYCCNTDSETDETSCTECTHNHAASAFAPIAKTPKETAAGTAPASATQHTGQEKQKTIKRSSGGVHYENMTSSVNNCTKDLIDNNKEFRIENNNTNLRIVGNNNRVKIANNNAKIHVIGNSTKVKIVQNNSHIQYTGNNGRIYLGSGSKEQSIDYIGCNGILKIMNPAELSKTQAQTTLRSTELAKHDICKKCNPSVNNSNNNKTCVRNNSSQPITAVQATAANAPTTRVKSKSASYGGAGDCKDENWQEFSDLLQRTYAKVSLPNLNENNLNQMHSHKQTLKPIMNFINGRQHQHHHHQPHHDNDHVAANDLSTINKHNIRIVNHFGNIAIKNSVNITIA